MTNDSKRDRRRAPSGVQPILIATIVLAAAVAPVAARAQEPARLVLGDVYAELSARSPRLEAARASARAAEARVASSTLPPDPQLQLGFMNYTLPGLEPMDPLGMTQLQLMGMLPVGGKLRLSGRVAAARAAAAEARAADLAWELRARAAMAFYELYEVEQGLTIARQTLRLLQDIAGTAESMYRVGEGRQADVLRAQVEVARMTEDTLRMRAMREVAEARLDALLDRREPTPGRLAALPSFPAALASLDSLARLAELNRPMLEAGEREAEAARSAERLARREIWPDLQLGVQYGRRAGEMGTEHMGSLMVGASVPLFARRRQLRMRDEAAAMREMAEADLIAMRSETRGSLAATHAALLKARRLAELYRGTVIPQAEATVASALAAYRSGGVDFMTLLDSRMAVNRYRQELSALDAEEGRAWAELEMIVGRQLFDPGAVADATTGGIR